MRSSIFYPALTGFMLMTSTFAYGAGSVFIKQYEVKLNQLGYHVGTIDGIFDDALGQALLLFEKNQNLPQTGLLNHQNQVRIDSLIRPGSLEKTRVTATSASARPSSTHNTLASSGTNSQNHESGVAGGSYSDRLPKPRYGNASAAQNWPSQKQIAGNMIATGIDSKANKNGTLTDRPSLAVSSSNCYLVAFGLCRN